MNKYLNIAFLSFVLLFNGCIVLKEDITYKRAYHTDYIGGKAYRTKQSVFVQELGQVRVLRLPGSSDVQVPSTIESYLKTGRNAWPEIVGILEVGTTVRIKRIIRKYNGEIGNTFYVFAEVLDGINRGLEVDLSMISLEHRQNDPIADVPIINSNVLEKVDQSEKAIDSAD